MFSKSGGNAKNALQVDEAIHAPGSRVRVRTSCPRWHMLFCSGSTFSTGHGFVGCDWSKVPRPLISEAGQPMSPGLKQVPPWGLLYGRQREVV